MSQEMIAIFMFSTMMLMLFTGQRVFGAIGATRGEEAEYVIAFGLVNGIYLTAIGALIGTIKKRISIDQQITEFIKWKSYLTDRSISKQQIQ